MGFPKTTGKVKKCSDLNLDPPEISVSIIPEIRNFKQCCLKELGLEMIYCDSFLFLYYLMHVFFPFIQLIYCHILILCMLSSGKSDTPPIKKHRRESSSDSIRSTTPEPRLRRDSDGDLSQFAFSPESTTPPSDPPEPEQLIEALQVTCAGEIGTWKESCIHIWNDVGSVYLQILLYLLLHVSTHLPFSVFVKPTKWNLIMDNHFSIQAFIFPVICNIGCDFVSVAFTLWVESNYVLCKQAAMCLLWPDFSHWRKCSKFTCFRFNTSSYLVIPHNMPICTTCIATLYSGFAILTLKWNYSVLFFLNL